jgi:hypothetical protein
MAKRNSRTAKTATSPKKRRVTPDSLPPKVGCYVRPVTKDTHTSSFGIVSEVWEESLRVDWVDQSPLDCDINSVEVIQKTLDGKRIYGKPTEEDLFYRKWLSIGGFQLCRQVKLSDLIHNYRNQHSVDFYDPWRQICIEINGGTFNSKSLSGHNSGTGINRDYTKSIVLQSMGFKVFCLSTPQARSTNYLQMIKELCYGNNQETSFWKELWKA